MSYVLIQIVDNGNPQEKKSVCVFQVGDARVTIPVVREGQSEFIELKTNCSSVWAPYFVNKQGDPLHWNFGDGTGDSQVGMYVKHDYRGLQGWKTIRITATDGFATIQRLALNDVCEDD